VLSDPEKRKHYDETGDDSSHGMEIGVMVRAFMESMFGGGAFEIIFGDPSTLPTSRKLIDELVKAARHMDGSMAESIDDDYEMMSETSRRYEEEEKEYCKELADEMRRCWALNPKQYEGAGP
jgi:DnaJ-class molecular chaperone